MKKILLLTKTLLAAVLLCVGQNAWAGTTTLINIDYSTVTTPAWTVVGGSCTITDGALVHAQGGGGGNRSAYLDLGIASSIDDNWTIEFDATLKPGSDRNDQQLTVAGAKTTYTNNTSATGYMYFAVKEESNGGTSYTVKIGNTDVATGVTLANGTKYHFKVEYDGVSAVTAYIGETKYTGTAAIEDVGKLRGLHSCVARYNGAITYDNIVVTKEVNEEIVSTPTIAVAYNGATRTVTITPGESSESNAVTTYYTTDGEDPTASSSVYSEPFDIDADCTIKAITIANSTSVASDIVSQAATVGKLKLATPTLRKTGYADGKYTVTMTSDQSGLSYPPASPTLYYSIDGGDAVAYSVAFELNEGSTVTGYVAATNYTNSDEVNLTSAARPTYYATEWTQDYRNLTSAAGTGAQSIGLSDVVFSVDGTDFKNIVSYGSPATELNLNTNVGLNTNTGVNLRTNGANSGILVNNTNTAKIGIQNLKVGDYIVLYVTGIVPTASYGCTLQEGMSTWSEYYFRATETSASINIPKGTYNYIYTITVLSATVSATIGSYEYATFSSTYPVNVDVDGLEAYIATGENGNYVTMQKVTGDVAANTGLVLKGVAKTYSLPVVASGTSYGENHLWAITEDGTVDPAATGYTNYVLSVQSENVVWAPIVATPAPIKAGQAALWLPASGETSARAMRFSGDITAVEAVEAASEAKAQEGKFIENGKIVIVKNGVKYNAAGQQVK